MAPSNFREVRELDQAGKVTATYTASEDGQSVTAAKTQVPFALAIFYTFLPAGYPHSVTDDYLAYQTFDSLQAFSSSIASLLANRAVLEGLGVGDAKSSPTAALVLKIIQDTMSRLATILFAHRLGQAIEPECKFYRFLADILNDCAFFLDLFVPSLPFWPKVNVMVLASVLRSLCGVSANASKASLSAHFARTGNLAELNAKEASQETVVSLMGMLAGTLVVHVVEGKQAVFAWMVVLVSLHLLTNYMAVRSVKMRTLNRQRATTVFREWLEHRRVLSPQAVAEKEGIIFQGISMMGRAYLTSKTGQYKGWVDIVGYSDILRGGGKEYERYVYDEDDYIMAIWHKRGADEFYMRIAVKHGATVKSVIGAWFDAVADAWDFEAGLKEGLGSWRSGHMRSVRTAARNDLFEQLQLVGWNLETGALETRTPIRLQVFGEKTR